MAENITAENGEKPVEVVPVVIPPVEEPVGRKSAKDFIIARKDAKIEKLQNQKDNDQDDLGLDDDEDEELTPGGKKTIEKTVNAAVAPLLNQARTASDEAELAGVFIKYPNLKELEPKIRKWMDHPAYRDASIEIIALGVAAKEGKGADADKKRQEADEEAAAGAMGGSTRRPAGIEGTIPDVRKMSDKEVDDLVFKVKTGNL